ncbi:MAG: spermidine/putrescine ABC transporter substrate-binding protein [Clostridia bacterium]|nr:spermidine/putrescine ABC transporter substrate-binding protein [Clostridia bacterium]
MKKALSFILSICVVLPILAFSGCGGNGDKITLNVYNWGEYIDMSAVYEFEKTYGIDVNYTTYASNEEMYAKVSSGAASYDIVIPSDYMIGKMIEEGLLAELDFANIPNYSLIGDEYKNLAFDPDNKYSVPYTWGTTVVMYNKSVVDPADVKDKSLDLLWNEKYSGQILMFDNPRDAFGLALHKLGYSMNTTNPDEWEAAAKELKKQKPILQAYVMDQIFDKMSSGEAAIAPYYAGDALIIQESNPDIEYFIPKEGANMFVDSMCVLKNSQHKTEAEMFINFMCNTDVAVMTAEMIGYATPHTEAKKALDPAITSNPVVYASAEVLENTEVFLNLSPEISLLQSELWTDIKKD